MDNLSLGVLNMHIVSMRPDVRRSRVHTINRLVRMSKKLKDKKGSEEQKEKNKRKAERLLEEVVIIKNLKDDEISKYSLHNIMEIDKVLADPKAPLKERALAKLSCHPNILKRVAEFREKFPTCEQSLPQLLKKLGKKSKKKTKPKVGRPTKKENTPSTSRPKMDIVGLGEEDSEKGRDSTTSLKVKIKNVNQEKGLDKSTKPINTKEIQKDCVKKEERRLSNSNLEGLAVKFSEIFKENSDKIQLNMDNNILRSDSTIRTAENDSEEMIEDTFFVCEDDDTKHYISLKSNRPNLESELSESNRNRDRTGLLQSSWNRNSTRSRDFGVEKKLTCVKDLKPRNSFQKIRPDNFSSNIRNSYQKPHDSETHAHKHNDKSFDMKKKPSAADNEPSHPSWIAKKRLKEQQTAISVFQGKKIKFED